MPYNTPVEQWSNEYAAQIQKIMEEGYRQNPDVPEAPPTDLEPMGAPGSLAPLPAPPTTPDMQGQALARPSMGGMGAPAQMPQGGGAGAPPPGSPPGMSALGTSALPGGGSPWQQVLPLVAAWAYGMNPETRHMAPLALQMGQTVQGIQGQKQLATIRQNVHQLAETQGPDAARQYLAQTLSGGNLAPSAASVLDKQFQQMTERQMMTQAIGALATGDPKTKLEAMAGLAGSGLEPKVITEMVKMAVPDKKIVQAGNSIFTYDPINDQLQARAQVPDKFNAAKLGGTDVTQAIRKMGMDPEAVTNAADQGDANAQGVITQAIKSIEQENLAKEERAAGRARQPMDAMAKAIQAGMVQSSKNMADVMSKPLEQERIKNVSGLLDIEDNISKLATEFTPEERARYVGMGGLKMSYQQALQMIQQGKADPKFARFNALVNYAKSESFKTAGKALTAAEQPIIFGYIPTGEEWSSPQFEEKINLAKERIGSAIDREVSLGTTAPGGLGGYVEQQRARRQPKRTPGGFEVVE